MTSTASTTKATTKAITPEPQQRKGWLAQTVDGLAGIMLVLTVIAITMLVFALQFATAESVEKVVEAFGIVVGGMWVLYQFVLRRSFESCLSIEVRADVTPYGGEYLVFVETTLSNIGNRRIDALPHLSSEEIESYEHSVKYPCDLQLMRISNNLPTPTFVDWWTQNAPYLQPTVQSISLLHEYSTENGSIEFFMEPSEKYVLGAAFILPAGDYLAKIVFVGSRTQAKEYWSRIACVHVPQPRPALST